MKFPLCASTDSVSFAEPQQNCKLDFFCCNTAPDTRASLCAYKIDVAWMLIRFNNFIASYEQQQNLEHTGSGSGLE